MPASVSAQNWGRGPVQATDLFPIALGKLNYYPSSPQTAELKQIKYRTALHWANTINGRNSNYIIDAESREMLFSTRYGLTKNLELGLHLPLLWRGSGVLDSFIYDWHKFWGFPQGPRFETEKDRYEISGVRADQSNFDLDQQGTKFGDLRLSAKKLFTKGSKIRPAIASEFLISTPTGSYSSNGFDLLTSIIASKKINKAYLYLGIFAAVSEETKYQDLEYERFRYGGSANIEFTLSSQCALIFGFTYGSNLTSDISKFPDYQLYTDLALKYGITESTEFEFMIRENPAPDRGSSDFSFLISLNSNVNL